MDLLDVMHADAADEPGGVWGSEGQDPWLEATEELTAHEQYYSAVVECHDVVAGSRILSLFGDPG